METPPRTIASLPGRLHLPKPRSLPSPRSSSGPPDESPRGITIRRLHRGRLERPELSIPIASNSQCNLGRRTLHRCVPRRDFTGSPLLPNQTAGGKLYSAAAACTCRRAAACLRRVRLLVCLSGWICRLARVHGKRAVALDMDAAQCFGPGRRCQPEQPVSDRVGPQRTVWVEHTRSILGLSVGQCHRHTLPDNGTAISVSVFRRAGTQPGAHPTDRTRSPRRAIDLEVVRCR